MPDTRPSSNNRTWLIGGSALVIAIVLAGWGIGARLTAKAAMKTEAADSSVPMVIAQKPTPAPPVEELVLPGQMKGLVESSVYARTSGYVKTWKTDIGARVKAGDLLAQIESPEVDQQLRQAQADLKIAQANAAVAKSTADRVQGLVATQSVSRQEGEDRTAASLATASQVSSQQANVDRLKQLVSFERITAPFSGVITVRSTDVGNLINAGSGVGPELFRIADVSRLRTYVSVPQSYAARIHTGSVADLMFPDRPGKAYPATVVRTSNAVDPQARTLLVELDIDNAKGELLPGAYVEVHFKLPSNAKTFRVNGNTLLFRADGLQVAVAGSDNKAVLKRVVLGRDFGATIEIIDGVGPNDRVILNPPASIQTGDAVHLVQPKAVAPAGGGKS